MSGQRDHGIDALRVCAMGGVVLGHWLVTGFVLGEAGLRTASPLTSMPSLAPITWVLQRLGLFFFISGFTRARSDDKGRFGRTAKAASLFVLAWVFALVVASLLGVSTGTLWFLFPYLVLRLGHPCAKWMVLGVLVPGPLSIVGAWAIPGVLGTAVAEGEFDGKRHGWMPAGGGLCALLLLVTVGGYPVSAVDVPGQGRSKLDPPSLAAIALAVTQTGVFLVIRNREPRPRQWVRWIGGRALAVYLWHQSVLLLAVGFSAALTWVPGVRSLIGSPDASAWVLTRIAWLPVLRAGLVAVTGQHRWRAPRLPRISQVGLGEYCLQRFQTARY